MYQKGVGYLVGCLVGYLAIYPRPSTKTASWTENWITDITESNSWYLILYGSSASVRGGSSGSIEPLNFEEKVKLNHWIFSIWLTIRNSGSEGSLFEPLDWKS